MLAEVTGESNFFSLPNQQPTYNPYAYPSAYGPTQSVPVVYPSMNPSNVGSKRDR
jgi:hypothetical protein